MTKKILKQVLEEIKPEKEKVSEVEAFLKKLDAEIKKNKIKAKAVTGGSYAKNTWLKGDYDVDIFVKFDMKHANDDLSKLLAKILKKFKPETVHGSRDYFWVKNMIKFEIVPVLDIKKAKQAQNVTDFSPGHVKWVNTKGKKYKDDIRLAKRFVKVNGVYGAESYIQGFSGHVIDILVIYYKGFIPLLRASQKWKPKQIIDPTGKVGKKATMILNKSKTHGPMIVIDPVQPERNAAAALNLKNFDYFIKCAKDFLKKPSKEYFEYKKFDDEYFKKKGHLMFIDVTVPEGKEDPVGAKLLKAYQFIRGKLKDFEPVEGGWSWDKQKKATFGYVVKKKKLPETYYRPGPPVEMKEQVKVFKKKHKKTKVNKGRIVAEIKNKNRDLKKYLEKEVFSDKYLKGKVKKCKLTSLS
ncbi:CCA tRNA nucleotidyltransferase [Candidatus Woesearchaeota archaeon]|nr:CCA tRNA nucleotidyltransferase [Candidatus Woesearchaeota archaeon]MBW2994288.1 CCA tRNA nucleotidyltransferase [Candidatus Woesearchaeota archaeon]